MAHTFDNTGFETAGAGLGLADKWTFVFFVLGDEYASYDATVPEPVEDFEEEWGNGDTYYEMPDGSVAASYDTSPAEPVEDFEEEWSNEPHFWTLPSAVLAAYDTAPEDYEDFEEEWLSNEDDITEFSGPELTAASYDVGMAEAFEDYEEEWDSNEDDISEFAGPELSAALFDGEAVEDFEEVDLRMQTIELSALGADGDQYIVKVNGLQTYVVSDSVGPLSVFRNTLVTYINALAVNVVASADTGNKIKLRSQVSGDTFQLAVQTTGTAGMIILPPPDKTMIWSQTGELDL